MAKGVKDMIQNGPQVLMLEDGFYLELRGAYGGTVGHTLAYDVRRLMDDSIYAEAELRLRWAPAADSFAASGRAFLITVNYTLDVSKEVAFSTYIGRPIRHNTNATKNDLYGHGTPAYIQRFRVWVEKIFEGASVG